MTDIKERATIIRYILQNADRLEHKDRQMLLYNLKKRQIKIASCGQGSMINLDVLPLISLLHIQTFIQKAKKKQISYYMPE